MYDMSFTHGAQDESQSANSCLAVCVQPVHLFVWMIERDRGVSFAPSYFIFMNSSVCALLLCLPHSHFPNSFCFCLGLSLVISSSHITSVTCFRENTKTECTNISPIISDSYNHSLSTRTAHFQNYKVEKQRSNAADFIDTKRYKNVPPLLIIRVSVTESRLLRGDIRFNSSMSVLVSFWRAFFLIYLGEKRHLKNIYVIALCEYDVLILTVDTVSGL